MEKGRIRAREIEKIKDDTIYLYLGGGREQIVKVLKVVGQSTGIELPTGKAFKQTVELKPFLRDVVVEGDTRDYPVHEQSMAIAFNNVDHEVQYEIFEGNDGPTARLKTIKKEKETYTKTEIIDFVSGVLRSCGFDDDKTWLSTIFDNWKNGER